LTKHSIPNIIVAYYCISLYYCTYPNSVLCTRFLRGISNESLTSFSLYYDRFRYLFCAVIFAKSSLQLQL